MYRHIPEAHIDAAALARLDLDSGGLLSIFSKHSHPRFVNVDILYNDNHYQKQVGFLDKARLVDAPVLRALQGCMLFQD